MLSVYAPMPCMMSFAPGVATAATNATGGYCKPWSGVDDLWRAVQTNRFRNHFNTEAVIQSLRDAT